MPTKARREREKALKEQLDRLDPPPEHIFAMGSDNSDLTGGFGILKGGLGGYTRFDEFYAHENIGKGGNDLRHNDSSDRARELRDKYPDDWGVRGHAKRIALDEGLSVRTIQKYFKNYPKN